MVSERSLYQIIANSTSDFLSVIDADYTYLAVNKAYSNGFGKAPEEIVGMKIHELLGRERFDMVLKDKIDRCLEVNQTVHFEEWFDLPNGTKYYSGSYTPMQTDCCNWVVVANVHDMTKHKLLEESLEGAVNNLQKVNSFKNKLFSIVSHDVKSPLGSIDNFLQLLGNTENDADLKNMIPIITDRLKTTRNMLDNLMDWTSSQIKGANVVAEVFNLHDVFNGTIELFKDRIYKKQLSVVNDLPQEMMITTDKNVIQLVLRNLLSNAIKFSNPGDLISLKIRKKTKNIVVLLFEDTGSGMSPEKASSLFGGIVGSETGTNGEKGSGLGMMLAADALAQINGQIRAESTLGKGTKFFITAPIHLKQ